MMKDLTLNNLFFSIGQHLVFKNSINKSLLLNKQLLFLFPSRRVVWVENVPKRSRCSIASKDMLPRLVFKLWQEHLESFSTTEKFCGRTLGRQEDKSPVELKRVHALVILGEFLVCELLPTIEKVVLQVVL